MSRVFFSIWLCGQLFGQVNVLTQHNDLARTGQNLTETILTPSSVSTGNFQKIFALTVDGTVEAQPLYVAALTIGGATHNAVFIATEHDSVFAFDADAGGAPLWQASLLDAAHGAASGATSNPQSSSGCSIANGEYGVSGTPVIDATTNTIYVVSVTFENNHPVDRLHALDIATGAEKFGGPVTIAASMAGIGNGSSNGKVTFDPNLQNQRAALALVNGNVYVAFGAYCDFNAYHGWLFAYSTSSLAQTSVFLTSPNGAESGIWMGAAAPASDSENGAARLFITTGNGSFDATTPYAAKTMDYGDDILRLDLSNGIQVSDAFTASNQNYLSLTDTDLGSSGTLILPDQPGTYPHLLVEASKGGVIYLVNRDNLGGYSTFINNVVQELDGQVGSCFGLPAYWNANLYLWPSAGNLEQFRLTNGTLSPAPVVTSSESQADGIGSTPSISADGANGGIVWSVDASRMTQILYAHDATDVSKLLWSSNANASRDGAGTSVRFSFPTVANGKVYVSSIGEVMVYGLPDFKLTSGQASANVTQGQSVSDSVSIATLYGFTGPVALSASNLPAGVSASFATAANSSTATFTAAANTVPGSYAVTISGVAGTQRHSLNVTLVVAIAPDFAVALSSATLTLTAGNSGSAQVMVTPNSSFAGSVSFTCSVASSLANVSCSVPGTVSGAGSLTLTVTAGTNARMPWRWRLPGGGDRWTYLFGFVLFAVCASIVVNRRTWRSAAVGFAMVVLGVLASCGGGGTSSNLSTSAVTETGLITVVATSGALSHSLTLSVTIQ